MLIGSQPLNHKIFQKLETRTKREIESINQENIESQYIGEMLDDVFTDAKKRKISFKTRLEWQRRDIDQFFHDTKHMIRNHINWHKAMRRLRPWEGFDGLTYVMRTHLRNYILYEEKHGNSTKEYKNQKIRTAKETIKLLGRMKDPSGYYHRRRKHVESKHPKYKHLITKYKNGSRGYSGDFVPQGNGWVGIESGNDPREGYFEFTNGRLVLANSPDRSETDRLLSEIRQYREEIHTAYKKAETDADRDFKRLSKLLKENMYSWWD